MEELGPHGTLGTHLGFANGKGCQTCLSPKMSLSRHVGSRRHPGAVAGDPDWVLCTGGPRWVVSVSSSHPQLEKITHGR